MKIILAFSATALLLAGCAAPEPGTVYYRKDGVKVYGLDEQPQSAITGQGSLMVGANQTHTMPTGQFTGKERTKDKIGQTPITPRETNPLEYDHTAKVETAGIVPPSFRQNSGQLGTGTPPLTRTNTIVQDIVTQGGTNSVPDRSETNGDTEPK
ncbi:MAG: hypothetical protein ACTHMT_07635 [Verrucomicrobiota bacterium]